MKKWFWFLFLLTIATETICLSPYEFYKEMVRKQKIGQVKEYYTSDLTEDILANRGEDIIIERCIGKCTNDKGDGYIFGLPEGHNYISYRSVEGTQKGDIIMTIFIYQPDSYIDDIVCRFDYIIDRGTEN